jgi:hypothetical protein
MILLSISFFQLLFIITFFKSSRTSESLEFHVRLYNDNFSFLHLRDKSECRWLILHTLSFFPFFNYKFFASLITGICDLMPIELS